MTIKLNHYCVFDLETTGLDTAVAQPIQIACKLFNSRSLEAIPGSEFCEYAKPTKDCKISEDVWEKTKIDPKDVEGAPEIKFVWNKFVQHVLSFNPEKNMWTAPIACGHNIIGYDLPIVKRMNELFSKKKSDTVLFSKFHMIDTMDFVFPLFENYKELPSYSLDSLRDFFGISKEHAHKAHIDVEHCSAILMRLIRFYREIGKAYLPKMKNSFKETT